MYHNSITDRRRHFQTMPADELDAVLKEELKKALPDGETVRMLLDILRERETERPAADDARVDGAWAEYRSKVARKTVRRRSWLLQIAAVLAFACVLFLTVPRDAEARGIFDRLIKWTDEVFALLTDETDLSGAEYVFETDNPGLQQVYDAVTELGVTVPVVPMWLPEGYELVGCEAVDATYTRYVVATFSDGMDCVTYTVAIYRNSRPGRYYKDETQVTEFEKNGIVHNIMRNNEKWAAVWTIDNTEAFIAIDCQEEVLYQILTSIYSMEDS